MNAAITHRTTSSHSARLQTRFALGAPRLGISLVEVIVVVLIVLILLALSIPFVRNMRELTRRSNCDQNLIRLGLAMQAYSSDQSHLPTGSASFNATFQLWPNIPSSEITTADTPEQPASIVSEPVGYHHNWVSALLPYVDQAGLFQSIDYSASVYADSNRLIRETMVPVYRCSSDDPSPTNSSYAGLHHSLSSPITASNDGLLFLNAWVRPDEVPDGMSATILLGEKLSYPGDLGWVSGTRATLRNSGTPINSQPDEEQLAAPSFVGGLGSRHFGGANVLKGDGAVTFLSETIDLPLYQSMVNRHDRLNVESNEADAH
jgi:type II secretory pathway pseudopilin PulG